MGYVAPAILTLEAIPSFASAGSSRTGGGGNYGAGSFSGYRRHRYFGRW